MRSQPRRFKVQRRVELLARDRSNKPFLMAIIWRTVAQADRQPVAEAMLTRAEAITPGKEFRLAEEWPMGTVVRPIPRTKRNAAGSSGRRRSMVAVGGT